MKKKTKRILSFSFIALLLVILIGSIAKRVAPISWGVRSEINQATFSDEAINGYDAVAYFNDQTAVKGNPAHTYKWKDATWYFSSAANKELFIDQAEKYCPQFGGYCSFAVSKGFTANSAPTSFEIIDQKLYLFADENMKANWMEKQEENLTKSTKNWK